MRAGAVEVGAWKSGWGECRRSRGGTPSRGGATDRNVRADGGVGVARLRERGLDDWLLELVVVGYRGLYGLVGFLP